MNREPNSTNARLTPAQRQKLLKQQLLEKRNRNQKLKSDSSINNQTKGIKRYQDKSSHDSTKKQMSESNISKIMVLI